MIFGQNRQDLPPYYKDSQQQMPADKRSPAMTTAAIVCSVVSISTTCCIYLSFVCGILGIIFALLSKGGEQTMSSRSKTALWVSVMAIFLTITMTIGSFITVILQYGSVDAFLKAYMELINN